VGRRISFLVYTDAWGGMELHTLRLADLLGKRGYQVEIVELGLPVFTQRGVGVGPNVRVRTLNLPKPFDQIGFVRWLGLLRGLGGDIGVFCKGWTKAGSVQFDLAARMAFRRFVTVEHSNPPALGPRASSRHFGGLVPGLGFWWHRARLAIQLRSVSPQTIIGVSAGVIRQLKQEYGFPARKLKAIPNGIAVERYHPDVGMRAASRARWGVPQDAFVFGTVGRLSIWVKGLDTAITLLGRLRAERPETPFWYVLVGEGDDRQRLQEMAREHGIADRVVFAGFTDKPWEAHSAIDVLLMPSRFEGIGLSLIESMASGCCPVAMGVGGISDVIADPSMGWLVPPEDTEAFYEAMKVALDSTLEQRRAMAERARAYVVANFRADEQYAKVADAIIEEPPVARPA
jgi:glycosyltransferase involved in cell wall biosynthesis